MEKAQEKIKKNFEVDVKIVLPLLKKTFSTKAEIEQSYIQYCNYVWGLQHFDIITVDEACEMIAKIAGVYYGSNS